MPRIPLGRWGQGLNPAVAGISTGSFFVPQDSLSPHSTIQLFPIPLEVAWAGGGGHSAQQLPAFFPRSELVAVALKNLMANPLAVRALDSSFFLTVLAWVLIVSLLIIQLFRNNILTIFSSA